MWHGFEILVDVDNEQWLHSNRKYFSAEEIRFFGKYTNPGVINQRHRCEFKSNIITEGELASVQFSKITKANPNKPFTDWYLYFKLENYTIDENDIIFYSTYGDVTFDTATMSGYLHVTKHDSVALNSDVSLIKIKANFDLDHELDEYLNIKFLFSAAEKDDFTCLEPLIITSYN